MGVGFQDGAQKNIKVIKCGRRLAYALHFLILFFRNIELLGAEPVFLVLLNQHVGPAGDWKQEPEVARLARLFVFTLNIA